MLNLPKSQYSSHKSGLVLVVISAFFCMAITGCTPKTKPSYILHFRSLQRGYHDKAQEKEIADIFALLQYEPNRANEMIENHLAKGDREWPFYALLGDVLIEAKRYEYAEQVLKLSYAKLIKRIPSAEIHDPNGQLPIETGQEFQALHDPRMLLARLYCEKIDAISDTSAQANAKKDSLFKEAIFYNPRDNGVWKRYSIFLAKQSKFEESTEAIGNLHCTVFSLDRGTDVRITGVKTPWSAADQYDCKAGLKLKS